jgi:hypothetical protein
MDGNMSGRVGEDSCIYLVLENLICRRLARSAVNWRLSEY